jgi:nucleotide sugar dehydrogenase
MTITVIGGGKMGLPLACRFADRADSVIVCDINPKVVASINASVCPIDEPGVPEQLARAVSKRRLHATRDTSQAVSQSNVVLVIVPALLDADRRADLRALESVACDIAAGLRVGTLVCFETTVPVGSTRGRFQPVLEKSGLRAGVDFDLAFSPERVKSLHVLKHLSDIPKIVGGVNVRSAARAGEFYGAFLDAPVLNLGTLEAAEFAKIAGMIYRDVNISLANELAAYAESVGVDFSPVREAANTDGEAALLLPGIGVGGHCTPVYPYFLIHDAADRGEPARMAETARAINENQVARTVRRLEAQTGSLSGRRVIVLGVAFRPGVREHMFSPAFQLAEELQRKGAAAQFHDPLYEADEIAAMGLVPCTDVAVARPEVLILNTAHKEYRDLDFGRLSEKGLRVVLDGRRFYDPDTVAGRGILYLGIGYGMPSALFPSESVSSLPACELIPRG